MNQQIDQEVEIISGAVYTSTFIIYNVEGKIIGISNEPQLNNCLEISNDLINDFKLGKKNFYNYNINYFQNLKEGIIQKEESLLTYTSFLYVLPFVNHFKNEITLIHNKTYWELKIRDDIKYEKNNLNFFLCKKNDPSYFYSYLIFDLSKEKFEVNFQNSFENDITKFSVVTMKKFNSYGIKEKNECT